MTNQEFLKSLGMEMKVARVRKGITVKELAEQVNLTIHTVSSIENGKADAHILNYKRIADALQTELKLLL